MIDFSPLNLSCPIVWTPINEAAKVTFLRFIDHHILPIDLPVEGSIYQQICLYYLNISRQNELMNTSISEMILLGNPCNHNISFTKRVSIALAVNEC